MLFSYLNWCLATMGTSIQGMLSTPMAITVHQLPFLASLLITFIHCIWFCSHGNTMTIYEDKLNVVCLIQRISMATVFFRVHGISERMNLFFETRRDPELIILPMLSLCCYKNTNYFNPGFPNFFGASDF